MNGRRGEPGTIEQGAFAQYKLMWGWQPLPAPEALGDTEAAMMEPVSVAVHAVQQSGLVLGDRAAVMGLGPIGLLVGACARLAGAATLMGFDFSPRRRKAALAMGFDTALDPREADPVRSALNQSGDRGMDVVFECAGAPGTLEQALQMARARGRVILVALCWTGATVRPVDWVGREVELRAVYGHGESGRQNAWQTGIDLVACGRLSLEPIHDPAGTFALRDIQSAFEAASQPDGLVKPVLVPAA
jgi:threonine dehydrogenase-like Zn-dependent dehydrogenase